MRVLLLLFIFLATPYLHSQEIPEWEYLNGPYGGNTERIICNNSTNDLSRKIHAIIRKIGVNCLYL